MSDNMYLWLDCSDDCTHVITRRSTNVCCTNYVYDLLLVAATALECLTTPWQLKETMTW